MFSQRLMSTGDDRTDRTRQWTQMRGLSTDHYVCGSSDHSGSVTLGVTRPKSLRLLGMIPDRFNFLQDIGRQTPANLGKLKRSPEIRPVQIRKPRRLMSARGLGTIH